MASTELQDMTLDVSSLPQTLAQTLVNFPVCFHNHFHKNLFPVKNKSYHLS